MCLDFIKDRVESCDSSGQVNAGPNYFINNLLKIKFMAGLSNAH